MHALVTDSRGRASTHHQPLYWDAVPSVRRAARRLRPPPAAALAPAATLLASASRALARLRLRRSRCSRRRRSLSLLAPRRRPVPFIAAPPLVVPLPLVTPPLLASRFTALLLLMLQECHMRRASFTEPPAFSPRRGSIRCSGRIVDPSSSRNPQPHLVLGRHAQRVELTVQPVATAVAVRILLVRVEIRIVGDELGRDACELVDMNVTLFANHRNIAIHGVHSSCKRNSGLWRLRMMVCRNPSIVSSVTFGSAVLSMANKVISTQKARVAVCCATCPTASASGQSAHFDPVPVHQHVNGLHQLVQVEHQEHQSKLRTQCRGHRCPSCQPQPRPPSTGG